MGTPRLDITGHRATITLDRPDKRNRIGNDDLEALAVHLDRIDTDREVRSLELRAEPPVFCAGYDLGSIGGEAPPVSFAELCDRLERVRVPSIAVIEGGVYGGGVDLLLACDLRIGTPAATLRMPAVRLGIQYYASGLRRATATLGPATAKRLFLLAEQHDADALHRLGVLDELVPSEELGSVVDAWTDALAAGAPGAVASTKAAIASFARGDGHEPTIDEGHRASIASADHAEALTARAERRDPRFTGT
ncbi:MAG: enoyl-CoA hydratase/isomerase family protein [Actinomycetota bacterium]|nr:enoyl-CoA hydratase/isomerase family protein [Actinomycetota bacterium]